MNPFSALTSKIFGVVALAMLLACTVQTLRLHSAQHAVKEWHSAFDAQKHAYQAAQLAARAKLIAQKLQLENEHALLARESDARLASRKRDVAAAVDLYARTHRVRAEAIEGGAGRTDAAGEDNPAQEHDGPSPAPEMVAITKPELDELVSASLRAEENRKYAESLILKGLAIPEEEFGRAPEPAP